MFLDINTYIGHWPFRRLRYNTLEGLDYLAGLSGATHMVVANLNGLFYKDANDANLELLDDLKSYNGKTKFLPLAVVNPTYPEWERDARSMINAGFAGFELAPLYHGYSLAPEMLYDEYNPTHRALNVLNLAKELDVPIRICAGFENYRGRGRFDVSENVTGEDLFALLSKETDVHVFITSFAPYSSGEHFTNLLKTRKNTYFDLTQCETLKLAVINALKSTVSSESICFGSMSPFNYAETSLLRLRELGSAEAYTENGAKAFKNL